MPSHALGRPRPPSQADGELFRVRSNEPPPERLLPYARLVVLQEHELPLLPLGELPDTPLCAANEDNAFRHVAVLVERMLAAYPSTVEEDEYALGASRARFGAPSHRSSRRDAALATTLTEKQLLHSLLGSLSTALHEYLRSRPPLLAGEPEGRRADGGDDEREATEQRPTAKRQKKRRRRKKG